MEHWATPSFFLMLNMEQFEKNWHDGSDGRCGHTVIRKRNLIRDSVRRFGLHPLHGKRRLTTNMTSLRDALVASSGNQAAEAQLYQADSTWACPGFDDDNASISSGSLTRFEGNVEARVPNKSRLGQRG